MRINGVRFGYDRKKPVLDGFDCLFKKGKITALIGPNGCGKSALLSLCGRLRKPQSGGVYLDGREISGLKDAGSRARRRVFISLTRRREKLPSAKWSPTAGRLTRGRSARLTTGTRKL
ncbi:MAG: ABC transporter ATP-binding protein [Clostridiales bacterium]|nr:ABC transporter ATP-binding protein [Clostridiales bacterium]